MNDVDRSVVEELVGNAHGNLVRVRELLDVHPAALNLRAPWNETAIEAATQMGDKPIIELLIGRGAPVDFFTACVLGRRDEMKAGLEADPSRANARGVHDLPALYFAAIGGDVEIAKRLLEGGADVNAKAESAAPIHGAVMGGRPELVGWMVSRGADRALKDFQGRDARELALALGRPELAALLG